MSRKDLPMTTFISYSPNDGALASRIANVLRQEGLGVWLAQEQILPGDNWAVSVGNALERADAMVLLLTPHAVRGSNIPLDLGYALGKQELSGRVVPVMVGEDDQFAPGEVPWVVNHLGVIRFRSNPSDLQLRAVAQAVRVIRPAAQLQPA
jgi:hypothetical protein